MERFIEVFFGKITEWLIFAAAFSFYYTIFNNVYQIKLEKKRYWYREHIIKEIFLNLDSLMLSLEKYVKLKNKITIKDKRIKKLFFSETKILKDKIENMEKTIKNLEYFIPKTTYFRKKNILVILSDEVENLKTNIFEDKIIINEDYIYEFYKEIKRTVYVYEKDNYKMSFFM